MEQHRETLLQALIHSVPGQYPHTAHEDRKQRCQSLILQRGSPFGIISEITFQIISR